MLSEHNTYRVIKFYPMSQGLAKKEEFFKGILTVCSYHDLLKYKDRIA